MIRSTKLLNRTVGASSFGRVKQKYETVCGKLATAFSGQRFRLDLVAGLSARMCAFL